MLHYYNRDILLQRTRLSCYKFFHWRYWSLNLTLEMWSVKSHSMSLLQELSILSDRGHICF